MVLKKTGHNINIACFQQALINTLTQKTMLHSHTRIWIHLVWSTKNHERIIFKEVGIQLYEFLMEKSIEIKTPFDRLNIQPEHVHGLIDLPTNVCLADFMQTIKGSSSHWINQNRLLSNHFSWQRGYGGYSVSASQFDIVKNYIKNQSEHHRQKTFIEEYEEWKREYGIFDD